MGQVLQFKAREYSFVNIDGQVYQVVEHNERTGRIEFEAVSGLGLKKLVDIQVNKKKIVINGQRAQVMEISFTDSSNVRLDYRYE